MTTYPYDSAFNPAAPMVDVQVSRPYSPAFETVPAMVDTGCDITAVPHDLVERLGLKRVGEIPLREVLGGDRVRGPVYLASLELEGHPLGTIQVTACNDNCILLGRDVLNDWKVTLDGPQGSLGIE
ncbi:MAG: retroviral-like aspartic protease family protein [Chloroflexi bacterium]|nr:retroviral-like aspartic protease family protein [Chloroflexota bacterium]